MEKKNITLSDIGKELGVSKNTVSRALRNCSDVTQETKDKVIKLAKEKGYVKNSLAVYFNKGITKSVAIVFTDFYNPIFGIMCDKTITQLTKNGYTASLYLCVSRVMHKDLAEKIINDKHCAVITFAEFDADTADLFDIHNIPFSMVGVNLGYKNASFFYGNDIEGGELIGKFCYEHGFKKPLYISNSASVTSKERYDGFASILKKHGIKLASYQLEDNNLELHFNIIKNSTVDFIFAYSDHLAIQIKSMIKKQHFNRKITIFGYDDISSQYYIVVPTNSVAPSYDDMIKKAVDHTITCIKNKKITFISKKFPVFIALHDD